jgi:hypothetical protein
LHIDSISALPDAGAHLDGVEKSRYAAAPVMLTNDLGILFAPFFSSRRCSTLPLPTLPALCDSSDLIFVRQSQISSELLNAKVTETAFIFFVFELRIFYSRVPNTDVRDFTHF